MGSYVADPASFLVPPRCAFTAQVPPLFSATLKENLLLGLPEEQVDLPRAIHTAALERDLAGWSKGFETLVFRRARRQAFGRADPARRRRTHVCARC